MDTQPMVMVDKNQLVDHSLFAWACEYRTIRGEPFSLKGHGYLKEIYDVATKAKKMVIQKSAQCGASELMVNLMFWVCERGSNTLYLFPSQKDINDFSNSRIGDVCETDPYIRDLVKQTDNVSLKKIGKGFTYLRGSKKRSTLKSIDIDLLILDEIDEHDQANIPLALKRLGHSKLGWIRMVSTPTYPEYGINKEFMASDQRIWHIKCDHCNEEQTLDFFQNIVDTNPPYTVCKSCREPIDRLKKGRWIPTHPEREVVGFHINKLMCSRTDLVELVGDSKKVNPFEVQEFYNSDLGLPYTPKGERINPDILNACKSDYIMPQAGNRCYMGVDVGALLHVRISEYDEGVRKAVFIGTTESFTELHTLMWKYDVCSCVIDALPETRKSLEFAEAFPGKVYRCYYSDSQKEPIMVSNNPNDLWRVTVNRTWSLDMSANVIINREINILPKNAENIPNYYKQMEALVRILIDTPSGSKIARYIDMGKPDHYRHAENYECIAKALARPAWVITPALDEAADYGLEAHNSKVSRDESDYTRDGSYVFSGRVEPDNWW